MVNLTYHIGYIFPVFIIEIKVSDVSNITSLIYKIQ